MSTDQAFDDRLNQVLPRLRSEQFLKSKGLGNEIAFHIFDYPADRELQVRKHIEFLIEKLSNGSPKVKVHHVNLLDVVVEHLKDRGFLEQVFEMQREEGDAAVLGALRGELDAERVAEIFVEAAKPNECEVLLVSGIGSVYPLIRTHQLLNNLHPLIPSTPVVFFYPGTYDGQHFHLFGRLSGDNYYRAFKLVS
ncbi:DUF1788 domain-containing protein [Myxococcota bacterium]